MHSDMQNMVHVMSAQLCDDGHHAAKYDSHVMLLETVLMLVG